MIKLHRWIFRIITAIFCVWIFLILLLYLHVNTVGTTSLVNQHLKVRPVMLLLYKTAKQGHINYCTRTQMQTHLVGNTNIPSCAINRADTELRGCRPMIMVFWPSNNGKRYYCYCRSTKLIRLFISSTDSYSCMFGNWLAPSTAQVGKLVSLPLPPPIHTHTSPTQPLSQKGEKDQNLWVDDNVDILIKMSLQTQCQESLHNLHLIHLRHNKFLKW